jgi:hypothetical protein
MLIISGMNKVQNLIKLVIDRQRKEIAYEHNNEDYACVISGPVCPVDYFFAEKERDPERYKSHNSDSERFNDTIHERLLAAC